MTPPHRDLLGGARARDLRETVATAHVIVCTGSGGVGKTTTAASLAVGAAQMGRRTIVLTIDPARRLAQALGLRHLDSQPRAVAEVVGLDAMMLDMKRTFDEVIERHAEDAQAANRIKANRFYQQLSSSLAGTQEYMAMEKLYDLHSLGTYDCIVVDTPPTRSALDFLDAPKRLTDFLEGRFLKMFLNPPVRAGRTIGKAVGFGTGVFMRAASRLTGSGVLHDLGEFFQQLEGMYDGFKQRAQSVYRLLGDPRSAFVVVASPEPPSLREARYFLRRLESDGMPLAGLVVNRVTLPAPSSLRRVTVPKVAQATAKLDPDDVRDATVARLLALHVDRVEVAKRERHAVNAAMHAIDPQALVEVPRLGHEVSDLASVMEIGAHLYPPD